MNPFDPANPFPLLPPDSHTYLEAQKHSAEVDHWLGIEVDKTEDVLSRTDQPTRREHWLGLPAQTLLTPYTEIRYILSQLDPKPGERLTDLGAGYGRVGHVIGRHYPDVRFLGYECIRERFLEAERSLRFHNFPFAKMSLVDLNAPDFTPVQSDYYFIYDFGEREAIEKTLQDLRCIAQKKTITVIGRGRSSRDAIERQHPWLSQIINPQHCGHHSIYRSA